MAIWQQRQDRLHQARRALGERLCRILHLQGEGRTPGPRDLLHPRRSQGDAGKERFRSDYNSVRPHSALGYLAPLEAIEAAA